MKYIVSRTDGTPIPEDEPCFVVRAKDVFAVAVLRYYRDLTEDAAPQELTDDMDRHIDLMNEWRRRNAHLVKIPD